MSLKIGKFIIYLIIIIIIFLHYHTTGRRYGFWATAINKMDKGHLRGFLSKHKNIYNVYKRQAPGKIAPWLSGIRDFSKRDFSGKWIPRPSLG